MTQEYKKGIVQWIIDNPGYVYSQFTFKPEYDGEELPTVENFEALIHDVDSWKLAENAELSEDEQENYPNAVHRYKYVFDPLGGALHAHVFTDVANNIQYIVVLT